MAGLAEGMKKPPIDIDRRLFDLSIYLAEHSPIINP
jgi:hypothetical protein